MRRFGCLVFVVALGVLVSSTQAKEEPVRLSLKAAADAVEAAHEHGDKETLAEVVRYLSPDPWVVAEELCFRGKHDAAAAFAAEGTPKPTAGLSAYVASRKDRPADEIGRRALAAVEAAIQAKDMQAILKATDLGDDTPATVTRIRLAKNRGLALRALGRFADSYGVLRKAAAAATKLGWLIGGATLQGDAGFSAYRGKDYEAARQAWRAGLAVAEDLKNPKAMASEHARLAAANEKLGEVALAIEHHAKAATLFAETGNKTRRARALHSLGALHKQQGRYAKARTSYSDALTLFREIGDKRLLGPALHNFAIVLDELGDYRAALEKYAAALEVFQGLGHEPNIAHAHDSVGSMHAKLGEYEDAVRHHRTALELGRKLGNRSREASALNNLGIVETDRGDLAAAVEHFEASRALYDALGDETGKATVLHGLAGTHADRGAYDVSVALYEEALAIFRKHRRAGSAATVLNSLGVVNLRIGRISAALRLYESSLGTQRAIGNKSGIARALQNIGNAQNLLGNHDTSIARLQEALRLIRETGDRNGESEVRHDLGGALESAGKLKDALAQYTASLAIDRELGDLASAAGTLNNIGIVQSQAGHLKRALATFQDSLALFEKRGDEAGAASAHCNIGVTHEKLGESDGAAKAFRKALQLSEAYPSRGTLAKASWGLAGVSLAQGDAKRAVRDARRGVTAVLHRVRGLAERESAGAREAFADLFDLGYRASLRAGKVEDLHWFLEQGRAGSLRESLGSRDALESAVIPKPLLASLQEARRKEHRALRTYQTASRQGRRAGKAAKKLWEAAQAEVTDLVLRVEREARAAAAVTLSAPDDLKTVRGHLARGEVLVVYALTKEEGIALVIDRTQARAIALAPSAEIEAAARALLDEEKGVDPSKATALRKLVVDPLALPKDTRRVLVSPMGILGYVPFGLLLPDHETTSIPSGTTLGLLLEERSKRGSGVLAIGDPNYRLGAGEGKTRTSRGDRGSPLQQLPATRKEVEAIGTHILLADSATEAALAAVLPKQARWRAAHFACHGLVDPENPLRSSLALTADARNDGFLEAHELVRLRLPADLVVMSACETGKGRVFRTEGILGLTSAFLHGGAPRVICSLWRVDDRATQALMVKFYEVWKGKVGVAEALRRAQAHVRAQEKWSHPYYWAAWVVWGLPD